MPGDRRAERVGCLQAIEAGHRNIHDQYIGPKLPHQPDRLGPVISFPDDFQVGFAVENHPQTLAHDFVVLGQDDPNRCHLPPPQDVAVVGMRATRSCAAQRRTRSESPWRWTEAKSF